MPILNQLKFRRTTFSDQAGLTANEWNARRLDAPELNKAAVSNYVSSEPCIVYQCISINLKSLKQNKLLHLCTCLGNGACGHSVVRMLAWFRVAEPFFISFFLFHIIQSAITYIRFIRMDPSYSKSLQGLPNADSPQTFPSIHPYSCIILFCPCEIPSSDHQAKFIQIAWSENLYDLLTKIYPLLINNSNRIS